MLPDYGKYEKGNKISYEELEVYLDKNHKVDFKKEVYSKMRVCVLLFLENSYRYDEGLFWNDRP